MSDLQLFNSELGHLHSGMFKDSLATETTITTTINRFASSRHFQDQCDKATDFGPGP